MSHNAFAIIRGATGILVGLGSSERAAWTEARRQARCAGNTLDENAHECREADAGMAWAPKDAGCSVTVQQVRITEITGG